MAIVTYLKSYRRVFYYNFFIKLVVDIFSSINVRVYIFWSERTWLHLLLVKYIYIYSRYNLKNERRKR
jgi:hypothetical protein